MLFANIYFGKNEFNFSLVYTEEECIKFNQTHMINDDTQTELDSLDWGTKIEALTNYVSSLMKIANVERYFKPEDIAMEAVERLYNGKRNRNKEKYTNIDWLLMSVARSILDGKVKNKITVHEKILDNEDLLFWENENMLTPELDESIINEEQSHILFEEMKQLVEGDDELGLLLLSFEKGLMTPDEICEDLGLEKSQYYNLIKKFRRRIQPLKNNN